MPFNWSLNPYMGCEHRCAFCYVRAFERRADRASGDEYGAAIRVKVNVAEVLERELSRRTWRRESVAVGAATDPYQPAEGTYRLTRACLEVFVRHRNPIGLITRGPMIVRDVDLLAELSRRAEVSVSFSIPTLDEEVWRATEPGTAHPRQRLRALSKLVQAGVKAGVGMAPLLPGLSDRPDQIDEVARAARDAGATFLWGNVLYLRPGTREHFLDVLARHWPEMLCGYRNAFTRAYLPEAVRGPIVERVWVARRRHGIGDHRFVRLEPPPEPRQLTLAV